MNERQVKKGAEYRDQYLSSAIDSGELKRRLVDLGWSNEEVYYNVDRWSTVKKYRYLRMEPPSGLLDIVRVDKTRKEGDSW